MEKFKELRSACGGHKKHNGAARFTLNVKEGLNAKNFCKAVNKLNSKGTIVANTPQKLHKFIPRFELVQEGNKLILTVASTIANQLEKGMSKTEVFEHMLGVKRNHHNEAFSKSNYKSKEDFLRDN